MNSVLLAILIIVAIPTLTMILIAAVIIHDENSKRKANEERIKMREEARKARKVKR